MDGLSPDRDRFSFIISSKFHQLLAGIGMILLAATASAQPVNDNFASRSTITSDHVIFTNTLMGATAEVGEPSFSDVSSGQTAWWTWTAPSNGLVSIAFSGMISNVLVGVYAGDDLSNLSLVASNVYQTCYQMCGCHWRERSFLSFHAVKGQSYQVAVDSAIVTDAKRDFNYYYGIKTVWTTNIVQGGVYKMAFDFAPAPQNDDFNNRTKLAGSRVRGRASNIGASKEAGEPDLLGNPGGSSVWYSWKAPASGRVLISTNYVAPYLPPSWSGIGLVWQMDITPPDMFGCGDEIDQNPPPPFYQLFGAFTGTSVESLTSAGYQPFALGEVTNAIIFDAVKGQTYQIAFDGNQGTVGSVDLYLMLTTPAANDSFDKRIKTHGITVVASGYNAGATHHAGEPVLQGSTGKNSWWSWVSPVTSTVVISLDGSDFAFPMGVFSGDTVKALKPVHTSPEGYNALAFEAVAGCTYQIAVADQGGLTGTIRLSIYGAEMEAILAKGVSNGRTALLTYSALRGQMLVFQGSMDGVNWFNLNKALCYANGVNFPATPPPTKNGPYYRALIVDLCR